MGVFDDSRAEFTAAFDDPDGLADTVKPITFEDQDGVQTAWRAIKLGVKHFEVDQAVKLTDTKFLALQHEAAVSPRADDLVICEGRTYHVIDVKEDPASITWQIYARA